MDGLQARLQSFKKSKRVKNPNKSSSTKTLKWPHPADFIATPETLAEAGFYYDPSYDDPDNVTCFSCEKQLGGWEEDDDPYLIHWTKCAQTCCWAVVQCGLRVDMDRSGKFVFPDKSRLPNHKTMEKARLETFTLGKGWVHDKTRNHGANSKSMARAGFAYTPQETGDDLATCLYCDVSLSGWDEQDDPMEEHRKRAPKAETNCPFFEFTESRQTKPPSSSRKSSAKTPKVKSRSASRSGLKEVVEEAEDDEKVVEAPPTVKKKTQSRSKSAAKFEALIQADAEEQVEQPVEVPPTIKSKAKARSNSVIRSEATMLSDGENEVATTVRKSARSRAKSKAPIEVEEDEKEEPIRKSSRSKSKVPADAKDDDVAPTRKASRKSSKPKVVEEPKVVNVKQARTTTAHKRTESKSRPKSPEVELEHVVATASMTKTTKSKPRSLSRSVHPDAKDLFNEDIVMVEEYVPPTSQPSAQQPQQPTAHELSPLFLPKRTKDKETAPSKDLETTSAAPSEKEAERAKRKPGRPPKAKPASRDKPKQAHKVVEVSSDEEEVEKRGRPTTKTRTMASIEISDTIPAVNGFKDSEPHSLEMHPSVEDTTGVFLSDAEPGTQEAMTDSEQELHTAPSTPPRPVFPPADLNHTIHPETPQSTLQSSSDNPADARTPSLPIPPLTTESPYLPPLSRLPFMPLQTLSDAELDMTVEEWIRYQIEVEQDRFKRDGERELERFKKRAEEVRKVIEGL